MLCSRCKKRPAVVFIATNTNSSNTQGLCLTCAKELGIKPVTDLMDKMGIDDEQLEAMQEQFGGSCTWRSVGEAFGGAATGKKRTTMPCLRREERRHFHFTKYFWGLFPSGRQCRAERQCSKVCGKKAEGGKASKTEAFGYLLL